MIWVVISFLCLLKLEINKKLWITLPGVPWPSHTFGDLLDQLTKLRVTCNHGYSWLWQGEKTHQAVWRTQHRPPAFCPPGHMRSSALQCSRPSCRTSARRGLPRTWNRHVGTARVGTLGPDQVPHFQQVSLAVAKESRCVRVQRPWRADAVGHVLKVRAPRCSPSQLQTGPSQGGGPAWGAASLRSLRHCEVKNPDCLPPPEEEQKQNAPSTSLLSHACKDRFWTD